LICGKISGFLLHDNYSKLKTSNNLIERGYLISSACFSV
jgi:hypothetical protein